MAEELLKRKRGRPRKVRPPQAEIFPEEVNRAQMQLCVLRLMRNQDFQMLQKWWVQMRSGLLEVGKEEREVKNWDRLDGFDMAICEPQKLAMLQENIEEYQSPTADLENGE